jgi:nucleotide-binding universal stress UspA family protein
MRILLAVDGSSPSQEAVDQLALRPWPTASSMRIISVVRPYIPSATEFVPGALTTQEVRQQNMKYAEDIVLRALERLEKDGLHVDTIVREGDPRTEIVDEATEWRADLIVVGSHGHTGLTRLLLGSVAQAVVAHAPCSVEVVRRRQDYVSTG